MMEITIICNKNYFLEEILLKKQILKSNEFM